MANKFFNANLTGYEQGAAAGTSAEPFALTLSGVLGSTIIQDGTNPRRSGGRSYKIAPTAGLAATVGYSISGADDQTEWPVVGLYIERAPWTGTYAEFGVIECGTDDLVLRIYDDLTPRLYRGSTLIATGAALSLNTWYGVLLELKPDLTSTNKDATYLRISRDSDDAIVFEASDLTNWVGSAPSSVTWGRRNTPTETTPPIFRVTDIIHFDSTGTRNNTRPRGPNFVGWAKPTTTITRGTGNRWQDGGGGTTALPSAIDHAPPTGTASGSNGTQIEHLGNGAGSDDYEVDCQDYVTAGGMAADDKLCAIVAFCRHGEYLSAATKTGHLAGINSNPTISAETFNFGNDVNATLNTDATGTPNWRTKVTAIVEDMSGVVKGNAGRIQIRRTDTRTGDVGVDQAGFMFVWERVRPWSNGAVAAGIAPVGASVAAPSAGATAAGQQPSGATATAPIAGADAQGRAPTGVVAVCSLGGATAGGFQASAVATGTLNGANAGGIAATAAATATAVSAGAVAQGFAPTARATATLNGATAGGQAPSGARTTSSIGGANASGVSPPGARATATLAGATAGGQVAGATATATLGGATGGGAGPGAVVTATLAGAVAGGIPATSGGGPIVDTASIGGASAGGMPASARVTATSNGASAGGSQCRASASCTAGGATASGIAATARATATVVPGGATASGATCGAAASAAVGTATAQGIVATRVIAGAGTGGAVAGGISPHVDAPAGAGPGHLTSPVAGGRSGDLAGHIDGPTAGSRVSGPPGHLQTTTPGGP